MPNNKTKHNQVKPGFYPYIRNPPPLNSPLPSSICWFPLPFLSFFLLLFIPPWPPWNSSDRRPHSSMPSWVQCAALRFVPNYCRRMPGPVHSPSPEPGLGSKFSYLLFLLLVTALFAVLLLFLFLLFIG
ncbi:hypothetical protein I7I53_12232 [Histoplasma capsulatum var. duboisii H88]|uniref:Uncharacterized protein n=1 Tax=Ajellomyces capsulatus (strain H88) TaxID=544711 RepID=A0A8A1LZE7_AJEC8|nr:hypothetical protein I7I53_12232 [Histoplasma capsulatum var. duboisii H88]